MAPPIAPPPDHRVNYYTPSKEVGQGHIAGGLFKFSAESKAGNFGGRKGEEDGQDNKDDEPKIPSVINYVAVEDINAVMKAVSLAGGKTVVQPWMERDEMARFALFEDTEGNVFGLIQYLM
jgi:predicted enzyme related to lactoylglutathione lyase